MPSRLIELIAPSGYPPDARRVSRAVERLRAAGHVIVSEERARRKFQRFCGTDAERLGDINLLGDAEREPADIALTVRGGYGLTRLLADVDYEKIARSLRVRPTLLAGHSDFTALQLALLAEAGAVTFSGPMLCADFGAEVLSGFTWKNFWRALEAPEVEYFWADESLSAAVTVSGTLWGGNLAMVCSLLGTRYFPNVNGGILFVEDVNEPPFRVERLLYQLHLSGVLRRQRALVLGVFSACGTVEYDNGYGLPAVVGQLRRVAGIPIVSGLPFGHCADKVTLPVGADGELRCRDGQVVLRVSGYPWLR
ncbi:MAG: muramoyltetrapeptide carboxypeptidase [Verrucomicrobiales bacterium]|jgi:muramoyltetrapeptide carboxypeptidase|nr:muramoyltetrapeptide carboxypeptidase [Verrucomicrobiales bacterium]